MSHGRLFVCLAVTVLAFSSIEVVANPIRHRIDPFALTFWRFALGALCLLPLVFRDRERARLPSSPRDLAWIAVLGVLNVVISMGAHALSIQGTRATTAAILIAANPLATNLFARLILGEDLGWRRGVALLTGFSGVLLVAWKAAPGTDTMPGVVAGLVGLAGFGLYTVLSKGTAARFGPVNNAFLGFLFAVLLDVPLLLALGIPLWPAPDLWPRLLVLGVIVSGLGYVTFFEALAVLPAGRTSLLFFAKPPVAMLLAWLFLGEVPSLAAAAGAGLVMAGILFDARPSPP